MRNYWYDELRKQKIKNDYLEAQRNEQELMIHLHEANLEGVVISQNQLEQLWSSLRDDQRELLYFHCLLEYTAGEISQEQGVPRGTILARIFRLRKHLQSLAEADNQHESSL